MKIKDLAESLQIPLSFGGEFLCRAPPKVERGIWEASASVTMSAPHLHLPGLVLIKKENQSTGRWICGRSTHDSQLLCF